MLKTPDNYSLEENLEQLNQFIPISPKDRIPSKTWESFEDLLQRKNIRDTLIDIHCHTFTHKNVPEDFLKFPKFIKPLLVKVFSKLVTGEFADTFQMKTQAAILKQMYEIYFSNDEKLKNLYCGLLMMDMERAIQGGVEQHFHGQILEVQQLINSKFTPSSGTANQYRNNVMPFIALDPHNPDMFKYFLSAFTPIADRSDLLFKDFNAIFQGVKLYPALGYLPTHPALMKVYAICEEKGIPITSHCGGIRTHPSHDKIQLKYVSDDGDIKTKEIELKNDTANGAAFSSHLIRPEYWAKVLKRFPNLKLNIAHLGSNEEWLDYRNGSRSGTVHHTLELIRHNKNVYADFSYAFYKKVNIKAMYKILKEEKKLQERVMYGSDYYMCQVEKHGTLQKYYLNVKEEFEKDMGIHDDFFVKNAIRFLTKS